MIRLRVLILLSALALLSGCAGTPERDTTDFKKAAQLNAELGLNYMVQGKNELAMEKLLKAVEYDDDSVEAHHYIAELYRRLERKDKAGEHFQRAADLAPNDSAIQNNYGVFLCGEKRYDEGVTRLLKAVENPVWPGRGQAYENLGQCLLEKGDMVRAEQYYREALKVNVNLPKALLAMADISLQQGNHISARAFLQRYAAVAPHTPHSLWLGIQIERVLGDRNALSSYGMLLRNNFPAAEETKLYLKSK
ncbi:type IV pilus biogenesis/stability protein PilW [Sulfurivermis fontis]|uniref:type IV pilus biogenesis/stability protein PilW n=1 Tax=Sulfurivermis fontis TaxID=1972068 RepID=UPI000FD940A7|nr:type IV pilus biogenesis/stability protein PilW [Sulfurivermis fontis]